MFLCSPIYYSIVVCVCPYNNFDIITFVFSFIAFNKVYTHTYILILVYVNYDDILHLVHLFHINLCIISTQVYISVRSADSILMVERWWWTRRPLTPNNS